MSSKQEFFQAKICSDTLLVACPGRISDYSTNPPTEPYVKISLIRFLGTARFHTARLPDIAGNPRHLSPSALQHNASQFLRSRGPPRHYTHPFPILGRGSGYAAIIRPNARHVIFRPPRRFSQYRHARVAVWYTRSRHWLLHRMP